MLLKRLFSSSVVSWKQSSAYVRICRKYRVALYGCEKNLDVISNKVDLWINITIKQFKDTKW